MSGRIGVMVAAVLLLSTGVGAAQTANVSSDERKTSQVFLYEMVLRSAVALGGQRLAQQALEAFPGIQLTTEEPIVRGVWLPEYGFHFDVQAPDIQSTLLVVDMLRSTRPVPVQPLARGRTAATGGLVEADPVAAGPGPFDQDAAYVNFVRDALIDALLDQSAGLPLESGERLTVTASGVEQPGNRLDRSRKLILTIGAEDLQGLRQGRITREEAKTRIAEWRF